MVSDLTDRLGPEILTVLEIKGQVLHRVRLHVKVPGWLLNLNALLTKKLPKFLSESILIFSWLVFQRHLFLCCQICLLCYGKYFKLNAAKKFFDILSGSEFVAFLGYGNQVEAFAENRCFSFDDEVISVFEINEVSPFFFGKVGEFGVVIRF